MWFFVDCFLAEKENWTQRHVENSNAIEPPSRQGRIDILVENRLIVELKAVEAYEAIHQAQVISYLKAMRLSLGLLINFNMPILKDGIRRIVLSH